MSEDFESYESQKNKRKEIYTYNAPWTAYSMAWRRHQEGRFQLAVGSFMEEYVNQFHILHLDRKSNNGEGSFTKLSNFDHPYPATRVKFAPSKQISTGGTDLLATTGDYLRIWNMGADNQVSMKQLLNNNKNTGFDWNDNDPSMIGVCSIDTTCTIWDLNAMTTKTQLIAHDKEVYDISFAVGKDIFGTVGGDGSVRMFDLRSLEHSTILYETPDLSPLLRLVWNKQDPNYLATILADSNKTVVLDIRMPTYPVAELLGHVGAVNGLAWAPHSAAHLVTVGEDRQALIWDVSVKLTCIEDPILAFSAEKEINQVVWCASHEDWIMISFQDSVQILKV